MKDSLLIYLYMESNAIVTVRVFQKGIRSCSKTINHIPYSILVRPMQLHPVHFNIDVLVPWVCFLTGINSPVAIYIIELKVNSSIAIKVDSIHLPTVRQPIIVYITLVNQPIEVIILSITDFRS